MTNRRVTWTYSHLVRTPYFSARLNTHRKKITPTRYIISHYQIFPSFYSLTHLYYRLPLQSDIETVMLRTSTLRALRPLRQTPVFARFYHEKVIDHYERPRNVGSLPKNDIDVGTGLYDFPFPLFMITTNIFSVESVHPLAAM